MLDLNTNFEYLIIYKYKGELQTWTMQKGALQVNYSQMKKDKDTEILGIYKKLSDGDILDIMIQ